MRLRRPCEHKRYDDHPFDIFGAAHWCPGGEFLTDDDLIEIVNSMDGVAVYMRGQAGYGPESVDLAVVCPRCGDVDPLTNVHQPWAAVGVFSNGRPEYTPACTCGEVFQGIGSADSATTARSVASRMPHPFGEKIYCPDPWHRGRCAHGMTEPHAFPDVKPGELTGAWREQCPGPVASAV